MATGWTVRDSSSDGAKDFSLLLNVQTASGRTKSPIQEYQNSFLGRRDVNLTSHLHPVSRLRISGVMPRLPLYAIMSRIGTLYLYINVSDAPLDQMRPVHTLQLRLFDMFRFYFLVYAQVFDVVYFVQDFGRNFFSALFCECHLSAHLSLGLMTLILPH